MKLCEKLEAHDKGLGLFIFMNVQRLRFLLFIYAAGPRNEVQ